MTLTEHERIALITAGFGLVGVLLLPVVTKAVERLWPETKPEKKPVARSKKK